MRQVNDHIVEKKKQVSNLRADLKEVMTRKAQLERRIQPLVIEIQKLEDQHSELIANQFADQNEDLIEASTQHLNHLIPCDLLTDGENNDENQNFPNGHHHQHHE